MDTSLSIVLPVHNAERSLPRQIAHLLDMLPDLTQRFEVLIVDDASTDNTLEVAGDFARRFPQLRVIRHPERLGLAGAVRTGMQQTTGDVVFVQEEIASLNSGELRRLWNLRRDSSLVMARSMPQPQAFDGQLLERLSVWGQALKITGQQASPESGVQMIRRQAVAELLDTADPESQLAVSRVAHADLGRTDASHAAQKTVPVRTFLKHLRDLALGE